MEKTLLDTQEFYDHVKSWATRSLLEEWSNDPDKFDDLEEFDTDVEILTNLDYHNQLYCELHQIDYAVTDFCNRYNKRYKTSVAKLLFTGSRSSHYGSIGGNGSMIGAEADTVEDLINQASPEDYSITITEEGTLQVSTYDHDGGNHFEMVLITQNEEDKAQNAYEDIRDMFRYKKHTKIDKAFKKEFGAV